MIGATRFSINAANGTDNKLKWIPRPDIYLKQEDTNYSVLTNLKKGNSYGTYTHQYWQVTEVDGSQTKNNTIDDKFIANGTTLGEKVEIANLQNVTKSDDGYYYTHVVVKLWVEGEDAEARLALSGGKFKLNFYLDGEIV